MKTLELIEQLRAGKDPRGAQAALYAIVRRELLTRIAKKIPAKLRARLDAEDVLSTAFLRAMQAIGRFEAHNENAFLAWVYHISKNLILDAGDRRSVENIRFAADDAPGSGPRVSQFRGKTTGQATKLGRREFIESLLHRLAPREAEVIRLHDLQGVSYDEISKRWSSTAGAVQKLHSRACLKLRKLAESEES